MAGESAVVETNGSRQLNGNGLDYQCANDTKLAAISRPVRDDKPFEMDIFPDTTEGRLLKGLTRSYLIKQEPRMGWARKSACDEKILLPHPCEVVASHQWGVIWLIMTISKTSEFQQEVPEFNIASAYEMASEHDLAELVTGDITPVDGVTSEEKHILEAKAMESILGYYPKEVTQKLTEIYNRYENRQCIESKFVKDCDRLDFMITAFVLERQKFRGFDEFYPNSNKGFYTKIAQRLADELIATREKLIKSGSL
jgi:5'-deoxynucleotidase YfbR-like HD superfamily hydrolase